MGQFTVYALSTDSEWLKAVDKLTDATIEAHAVHCTEGYERCTERLSRNGRSTVLLMDAMGVPDIAGIVARLRQQGWHYIVVVSAAPTWKEAYAVLRVGPMITLLSPTCPPTSRQYSLGPWRRQNMARTRHSREAYDTTWKGR